MRIVTYNVENLFDTKHDSTKNDVEFLPNGDKHWTQTRFRNKINNISRVIASIGEWKAPMLVGLCEVENDYVLKSLVNYGPLNEIGYDYLHYESEDRRGIDVAMLYRPEMFTPIVSMPIEVYIGEKASTRDILYVCGELKGGAKLHVFQVHFPSRRGGERETEEKRISVAKTLRASVDSIFEGNKDAAIVIMGDFNDYPNSVSVADVLYARDYDIKNGDASRGYLYNLTYELHKKGEGSYCIRGEWVMLDQIIVSGALLNGAIGVGVDKEMGAQIFEEEWMMKYDERQMDSVPKRTYNGMRYEGGYSDHLPVYVDLK